MIRVRPVRRGFEPVLGPHHEVSRVHLVGKGLTRLDFRQTQPDRRVSGGATANAVPVSNGPSTSIVSIPSFHCGQAAMSAQ